jgi:hypothetical protein
MPLLLALLFLIIGVFLIQRPRIAAGWIGVLFRRGGGEAPAWVRSGGMIFFIRLMGFLALVNATMYFYLARNAPALGQ